MKNVVAAIACFLCAGGWFAQAGEIQGRIEIIRGLTKKRVSLPSYQFRGASMSTKQPSGAVDELSHVAVYLEGRLSPGRATTAELKQRSRRFEPNILVVPAGSTVSFPNGDPMFHNVFSLSKAKQFDLGYYPIGETRTIRFDKAGVVQVHCHLHPNMKATILVVPSAFYARSGADGTFKISDVPAGDYQIVAWHKSAGLLRKSIHVPENGLVETDFVIPAMQQQGDR